MNKQETKRRLNCLEADCKNLGTEISILKATLAEPEKLKLEHGDFGINKSDLLWLAVRTMTDEVKVEVFWYNSACPSGLDNNDFISSRLGNIFDLMKDWGEDLTHFELDVHKYKIDTRDFAHSPIHIAGNWHTLAEAEEIWRKLGQMIMTLKRKENK